MSESGRIRDYFETAEWTPSAGRRYLVNERTAVFNELVARLNRPMARIAVCDVGCGFGQDLAHWRDAGVLASHLAGTELVAERAKEARARVPGARIQAVDGVDLPFESGAFDVCTASLVLSTILSVSQRRRLVAEMARVTRTDGLVLIYDFAVKKPWNRNVAAVSTRELTSAWRTPDIVQRAAPFLPLLELALMLPPSMAGRVTVLLPRTHRVWAWRATTPPREWQGRAGSTVD